MSTPADTRDTSMAQSASRVGAVVVIGAIAAIATLSLPASAESFVGSINPPSLELGEVASLVYTVEGGRIVGHPTLSLPDGVVAPASPSVSTMHRIAGGRRSVSQSYTYALSFAKAGTFTIGPATIEVGGRTLRSNPVKVVVREAGRSQDLRVFASLTPSRAYVGQPVVAMFEIALARENAGYDIRIPFLKEVQAIRTHDPENLLERWEESVRKTRRGLPGYAALDVSDPKVSVVAEASKRDIDGVPYDVYTVKRLLLPQQTGRISYGVARALVGIVTGYQQARDPFFDDGFFGPSVFNRRRAVTRNVAASSEPLALEVLELPAEGRPDGFEGAVGRYQLTASVQSDEAMLGGSPIQLTFVISGEGNLETVGAPKLVDESAFRVGAPEQQQEMRFEGNRLVGEKRFTVPLRPRTVDATHIPEAVLPVFDPQEQKYVVLRTAPIPISITVPENTGAAQSVVLPPVPTGGERAQPARLDIEDIDTESDPTESHRAWIHTPAGIIIFFVLPAIAYAALAFYAARMRRLREDIGLARRLSALSNAAARFEALRSEAGGLDETTFASKLSRVLQTYLADALRRPAGELPAREAEELLRGRGASEEVAREAVAILGSAEAARFGGEGIDRDGWLTRVERCIESLEKEIKR